MSENDSNLSNTTERFEDFRKFGTGDAARAMAIIEKHLVNAGLPFKTWGKTLSWSGCGSDLYSNIHKYLGEEKHSNVLKAVLAELVNFCEASNSESFVYNLKELFQDFFRSDSDQRQLAALSPLKAVVRFDEIRQMICEEREEYTERLNQMYY
jgi:hypothetical protein